MLNDTRITIVGNVGADPELRFTPSGAAVVTFSVAVVRRRRNEAGEWVDGNTTWWRINAWRGLAENITESIRKGLRVIVVGTVESREWTKAETDEKGISWEITADAVGPELTWATAAVHKATRGAAVPPPDDPWATAGSAASSGSQWPTSGEQPPF